MSESNKARVGLRVDADMKAEWDSYVDESGELSTLSQLVRLAVAQYIATDGRRAPATAGTEAIKIDSEAKSTINRVERKLDDIIASHNSDQSGI